LSYLNLFAWLVSHFKIVQRYMYLFNFFKNNKVTKLSLIKKITIVNQIYFYF
jgi:hypothetical protein